MKKVLLIVLCLLAFPVMGSHIVGGEFEIIFISGNSYRVNLILYFDAKNGDPGALDDNVSARIFRLRDNVIMRTVSLPLIENIPVKYTQAECSDDEIITRKLTYSTVITMTDELYSDEQGYYLSWERCCRNYSITNIFSNNPTNGGQYAGQTFYLEFPPVTKNGQKFINSTPRLFPPLSDYACPGRPYYVDFAGTDDDGDSLVYSLVTPLNTKSADALPPGNFLPRPKPYPNVVWRSPFGPANIMGGAPDLHISRDGFLRVTPQTLGLFVFAVRCQEFRNGEKIGEVRRDFQMLVTDACPKAEAPKILGKKLTDASFEHENTMTVTVDDTDRCIQVQVSDPDALRPEDGYKENIKIKAIPLNFKKDIKGILPSVTTATLTNGSTKTFDICFDRCPPIEDGPFQIAIVASDDACSLPLSDTLKITVNMQPPANANPYFTTSDVTDTLNEEDVREWPIAGKDDDLDSLVITLLPDGFDPENVGMSYRLIQLSNGNYQAKLVWDTHCDVYDFKTKTEFELKILLEDVDDCTYAHPDTMTFNLKVLLPENALPEISTDLPPENVQNGVTRKIFERLDFNVFGNDADQDSIFLSGAGNGFDFSSHDINFPAMTPRAKGAVSANFMWEIDCDQVNLDVKDEFEFEFIVVDNINKCGIYKADTLKVKVKVEPPDNIAPVLSIANMNPDLSFIDNEQSIEMGQQISLELTATDADMTPHADLISIDLVDAQGNVDAEGYAFTPVQGQSNISTLFTWNPECYIFKNRVYQNQYTFKFKTVDDRCFNQKADSLMVNINIRDIDARISEFIPPNIITPNGDGYNEFFAMVRENKETLELENILPLDNCSGRFVNIVVYNRWGNQVFESNDRDFRWYPSESVGVYFYTVKYTNADYKGTLTLRN
jgi:hypothetical protein